MKTIPLSRGLEVIVDDDDYERFSKYKWHAHPQRNNLYAGRALKNFRVEVMHRIIVGAEKGEMVDHLNRNTLDNRKENLRIATIHHNNHNRVKGFRNKTGLRGVSVSEPHRWRASIRRNGVTQHLGCFASPAEAAKAYDQAAILIYGEHAVTNFDRDHHANR